jgi:hypothetical protein
VPHKAGHHLGQAPIGFRARGSDDPVGEGGIVLGCLGYAAGPELHSWCWRWVGNHLAHVESRGWGEGCWLGLVRQAVQCGGCFQGGFRGRMVEGWQTSTCTCTREGNKVWTGWSHCRGNARKTGWPWTNDVKVLSLAQHILQQRGSGLGHTKGDFNQPPALHVVSIPIAPGSCRHPSFP